MYIPKSFQQQELAEIYRLIEACPLGTLVHVGPNGPDATHLPFELVKNDADHGLLCCHVARANPLWKQVNNEDEILVIFNGPNAYVSPGWYPSKQQHGKVVPT